MKDIDRVWHPSFGYLKRTEVENLNAMKDGIDYRDKRKKLEKAAAKAAKSIPFPPLKTCLTLIALLAAANPALAGGSPCPAGSVRTKELIKAELTPAGGAVVVQIDCTPMPVPEYEHPTLVQNAPPIDEKIINLEEE